MAQGGRSQKNVFHIHIHNTQEGDKTDVNNSETNISAANIEQLSVQQQEADNEATEGIEEQDEIIHEVDALNLSSPIPTFTGKSTSSVQKKGQKRMVENQEGKSNSLTCGLLLADAAALCEESKYLGAASKLEKLVKIQGKDVGVNTFLRIAEVSIQLGRKQEAKKAINDVVRLSMTSPSDVDNAFRHACDYVCDKSFVRAIVLLRISSEMYKLHPTLSPDDIVEGIRKCVDKISIAVVKPMINSGDRSKLIALDYGLPYMIEMVDDFRAVEACNPDVKAKHVAYCVNWIGLKYNSLKENEKSIKFYKSGLDVMERQFGQKASKYEIYGILLNNIGSANYDLGRNKIAEDYYVQAIDAQNNATDFSNEDKKRERIEMTQNILKITRAKMK